jgi:hypothetical protein
LLLENLWVHEQEEKNDETFVKLLSSFLDAYCMSTMPLVHAMIEFICQKLVASQLYCPRKSVAWDICLVWPRKLPFLDFTSNGEWEPKVLVQPLEGSLVEEDMLQPKPFISHMYSLDNYEVDDLVYL